MKSFGNWSARFIPPDRIDDATIQARDQILRGLDRLTELNLSPSVYVNHSGSPSNVGGPWGSYQRADLPDERLYALDALRSFGFRFFWLDATTDIEKFGNELVFADKADLARAVERYSWGPWLRRKDADGQIVAIELPSDPAAVQEMMAACFNRAIFPVTARDGQLIHAFKRYRDIDQPVGATFPCQVTSEKLDELERRCGSVVVYQHFGVFGPRGRMPAISRPHRKRSPIPALDRHSVATWRLIADRNHAGRLFVATQGRLLDWIWRRSSLQLSWTRDDSRLVISLDHFSCPVEGTRPVGDDDLNGLAFVVPANAPEVIVTRPGRTGTITVERASDGANDVVFIPWQSLKWPDGF